VRVVVFGAGAIGSLLGAYLDRAGHSVLLIARPDQVAAIRAGGIRLTGKVEGTFHVDAAEELPPGPAPDAVLLTVKAFDLARAATAVARGIRPGTPVLLPQNGLGILELATASFRGGGWSDPGSVLVRAVNSLPATLVRPGEIRVAGQGELVLSEPRGISATSIELFTHLFREAGVGVRSVPDLTREVWKKVVVNAAINPVTALRGVVNGRLLGSPYREEADRLLLEAASAARAAGIEMSDADARAELDRVVHATAENRSSMLQDLDRGRPTEIEAISGELLRAGETHGLDLPATRAALAEVRKRAGAVRR
jgi:2-dehydropantoate 2-reductase